MPAFTRAVKLQSRAAQAGFDWPSLDPVLAKAEEEVAELKAAMRAAYGETVPALLGQPCDRPLIPRGYRHLIATEDRSDR